MSSHTYQFLARYWFAVSIAICVGLPLLLSLFIPFMYVLIVFSVLTYASVVVSWPLAAWIKKHYGVHAVSMSLGSKIVHMVTAAIIILSLVFLVGSYLGFDLYGYSFLEKLLAILVIFSLLGSVVSYRMSYWTPRWRGHQLLVTLGGMIAWYVLSRVMS